MLTNLFLNSIAHAYPDAERGSIDITVSAAGANDVEIIFADDGCGMTSDVRRQAFDPFFTTRRHQGCTGLGLHIVYSVVTDRLEAAFASRANRERNASDDPAPPTGTGREVRSASRKP